MGHQDRSLIGTAKLWTACSKGTTRLTHGRGCGMCRMRILELLGTCRATMCRATMRPTPVGSLIDRQSFLRLNHTSLYVSDVLLGRTSPAMGQLPACCAPIPPTPTRLERCRCLLASIVHETQRLTKAARCSRTASASPGFLAAMGPTVLHALPRRTSPTAEKDNVCHARPIRFLRTRLPGATAMLAFRGLTPS